MTKKKILTTVTIGALTILAGYLGYKNQSKIKDILPTLKEKISFSGCKNH